MRTSSKSFMENVSKLHKNVFSYYLISILQLCLGEQRQRRLITEELVSQWFFFIEFALVLTCKQTKWEERWDCTIYRSQSQSTNLLLTNRLKAGKTWGEPSWVTGAGLAMTYQSIISVCLLTGTLAGKVYQRWTLFPAKYLVYISVCQ